MRTFRFRLDPVMRLKDYQIQLVEDEIAKIDRRILQLIQEIEAGRTAVQNMRRRIMEDIDDDQILQAEIELSLFTDFMNKEEYKKRAEITRKEQEKEKKRQQLIHLYQEQKVLERLKERRKEEWEKDARKEEGAIMDEIGTQKYIRRKEEFGGALLYLIIPIALIAAVAAIGIATGYIDQSILNKLPFFGAAPKSATTTIQSATGTLEEEFITLEQMIGDPDTPMPELLKNFADYRAKLRAKERALNEREQQLKAREESATQQLDTLANMVKQATQSISELKSLRQQIDDAKKSELSQYEDEIAQTLSSAKGKEIATIMTNLYNPTGNLTDLENFRTQEKTLQQEEETLLKEYTDLQAQLKAGTIDLATVQAKEQEYKQKQTELKNIQDKIKDIRDSQLLLLRILHRFQARAKKDLFAAMNKADSKIAAMIIRDMATTDSVELYNIQPTPTPIPTPPPALGEIGSGTSPLGTG